MIYYCEKCRFLFSRAGEVETCPDCGKVNIRQANEEETVEYKQRLERKDQIWNDE